MSPENVFSNGMRAWVSLFFVSLRVLLSSSFMGREVGDTHQLEDLLQVF